MKRHVMDRVMRVLSLFLVICLQFGLIQSCTPVQPDHSFVFDEDILRPFYSDNNMNRTSYLQMQENGLDYTHYYLLAGQLIYDMSVLRTVDEEMHDILECLMDTYMRYRSYPRPSAQSGDRFLEYGWVTAMDAPSIGVAMILAYELTGDEHYIEFLNTLIPFMKKDVEDGGYLLEINGKRWLLEYAWSGVSQDDAFMVLNGSLFGACGTAYIAAYVGDKELRSIVNEQIALYQEKMHKYERNNRSWYYYMLNPLTINQSVKLYIEITSFLSLSKMLSHGFLGNNNGDVAEWLNSEAVNRREAYGRLKRTYAVQTSAGDTAYLWSRYAAPHPYMIDLKNVELVFYNSSDEIVSTVGYDALPNDIQSAGALVGSISKEAKYVKYFFGDGIRKAQIGEGEIIILSEEDALIPAPLTWSYEVADDVTTNGEFLLLDADQSDALWGSVYVSFQAPRTLTIDQYYSMEIDNRSEKTFGCGITLYDSDGLAAFRYLPEIVPGKNLQLFNIVGFLENQGELKDISRFHLRFYTNRDNMDNISVLLSDMYCFENTVALHQYVSTTEYRINQQP